MHSALPATLLVAVLAGCSTPPSGTDFVFPAEQYGRVFDAARDQIREAGYTLERIDAGAGEIITAPKIVAGFASPNEPEINSIPQAIRDTLNLQPRTLHVRFRDADADPDAPPAPPPVAGYIRMDVDAVVWRQRRVGWRVETETIRTSRYWIDPSWIDRGVGQVFLVPQRRDPDFAAEIAEGIRASAQTSSEPPEPAR